MYKLSIIMPIYNGDNYINKTIPYLLNYPYDKMQLVLVDDGSVDKSLSICKSYALNDRRVKVIHQENKGIAEARNFGVKNAEGEYLAFVDQDDLLEVDKLICVLENVNNSDIIMFSTVKDYQNYTSPCDTVYNRIMCNSKQEIFEQLIWPMIYPTVDKKYVSYLGHVWQAIYSRELVTKNEIVFKRFVSIEDDYMFLLESFLVSNRIIGIPNAIYHWVVNYESTTYKVKYIDHMLEKCGNFYSFCNDLLHSSIYYTADLKYKYIKMSKQLTAVRVVINEGARRSFWKSRAILKKYVNENSEYFDGNFLGEGASRKSAKIIYILIKYKLYSIALILQKLIIAYHIIKKGGMW